MEFSDFGRGPRTHVHVHVVVNYLKQFSGLRNAARLNLGPDRHVVEADLESPGGDELGLHGVTEEEGHHAGVDLVLQHPGCPGRSVHTQEWEWIERREDHQNDYEFTNANNLGGLQPANKNILVPQLEHLCLFTCSRLEESCLH